MRMVCLVWSEPPGAPVSRVELSFPFLISGRLSGPGPEFGKNGYVFGFRMALELHLSIMPKVVK